MPNFGRHTFWYSSAFVAFRLTDTQSIFPASHGAVGSPQMRSASPFVLMRMGMLLRVLSHAATSSSSGRRSVGSP